MPVFYIGFFSFVQRLCLFYKCSVVLIFQRYGCNVKPNVIMWILFFMALDENILRSVVGVYKNDLKCIVDTYLKNDDSVDSYLHLIVPWMGWLLYQVIFN